jgi:hypothetical protein
MHFSWRVRVTFWGMPFRMTAMSWFAVGLCDVEVYYIGYDFSVLIQFLGSVGSIINIKRVTKIVTCMNIDGAKYILKSDRTRSHCSWILTCMQMSESLIKDLCGVTSLESVHTREDLNKEWTVLRRSVYVNTVGRAGIELFDHETLTLELIFLILQRSK